MRRRERILPGEMTPEKISRYEAHQSRQLYHALHELENPQEAQDDRRERTPGQTYRSWERIEAQRLKLQNEPTVHRVSTDRSSK